MTDADLKTYKYGPVSEKAPESVVILLHGLGANGRDLIELAPYFAEVLPDTVFLSPDAPFPCDMAPVGFQWFSLQDRAPEAVLKGVREAAPVLEQYIDLQLEKYGLPASRLALVGFSQGTMMSLYAGLRYQDKIAGILGYSGALAWDADDDAGALHKVPVQLVHGTADPVVPFSAYHYAMKVLEDNGFEVLGEVREGLGHGIDPAGIETGKAFLQRIMR